MNFFQDIIPYELVAVAYIAVAISALWLMKRRWLLNPVFVWILGQMVFCIGTVSLSLPEERADYVHLACMFVGLCTFIFGSTVVRTTSQILEGQRVKWFSQPVGLSAEGPETYIVALTLVFFSIVISTLYFQSIGYNLFLDSITSVFRGQGVIEDISTLRLAAYAGSRYLAPGYVNQFKNVLLPLLSAYLVLHSVITKQHARRVYFFLIVLVPMNIIFLLGTGQRGAFVIASAMIFFYTNAILPQKQRSLVNRSLGIVVLLLFGLTTLSTGRAIFDTSASGGNISGILSGIFHRLFVSNQLGGVVGFRYVYESPIQYGLEWYENLRGVLPGAPSKLGLSNQIFALLYGGTRGTTPVSIWGSIWHNFGPVGIILVPFGLGAVYQYIYNRMILGPKSLVRVAAYAAMAVVLGTWAAGGPIFFVNSGVVTVLILIIITRTWQSINRRISGARRPYMRHAVKGGINVNHNSTPARFV